MLAQTIINWLPFLSWLAIMVERCIAAVQLRRQGVRAVNFVWRRPLGAKLESVFGVVLALLWIYLLLADAWGLPAEWLPEWLTAKLIASAPLRMVGAALALSAPVIYQLTLNAMGASWRIGIDERHPGPLVTSGLFAWSRNPIYTGFDFLFLGAFLVHGRVIYLLLGFIFMVMLHMAILCEERFLTERFGEAFRDYRQRVRRYGIV